MSFVCPSPDAAAASVTDGQMRDFTLERRVPERPSRPAVHGSSIKSRSLGGVEGRWRQDRTSGRPAREKQQTLLRHSRPRGSVVAENDNTAGDRPTGSGQTSK